VLVDDAPLVGFGGRADYQGRADCAECVALVELARGGLCRRVGGWLVSFGGAV
jgi:hypothetical protein